LDRQITSRSRACRRVALSQRNSIFASRNQTVLGGARGAGGSPPLPWW
jgi:hypothetical protein